MSDQTTVKEPEAQAPEATAEEAKALPSGEPERVSFWNRPYVEQFLVPLVLPVAVILFVVVYVINISRLFLSGHEHIPVIVGATITTLILIGATLLSSAATRLTKSLITLLACLFLLAITGSGWLLVGTAEGEGEGATALAPDLKTQETIKMTAAPGGALAFAPNDVNGPTGLIKFDIQVAAPGHTFAFTDAATKLNQPLQLEPPGETIPGVGFFGEPGDYEFICTIPGHAEAGMKGVLTVEGDPITLEEALVDAGNEPGAASGGEGH